MPQYVDLNLVDFQPPKKVLKTSTGQKFNLQAAEEDIAILSKGCVPKNTVKNNVWGLQLFYNQTVERNNRNSDSAPKC